jgi:dipeptidyl aminopeptidase/acylaminoacyl peptidase
MVGNWDTPILVIHDELDFRVPVSEGMQAFGAARLRDLRARFLYIPDEGHWVMKPQNALLWHREFFRWLRETL